MPNVYATLGRLARTTVTYTFPIDVAPPVSLTRYPNIARPANPASGS